MGTIHVVLCLFLKMVCLVLEFTSCMKPIPETGNQGQELCALPCSLVHLSQLTQTLRSLRRCQSAQGELSNTSLESTEVGKYLDCRDVVRVGR